MPVRMPAHPAHAADHAPAQWLSGKAKMEGLSIPSVTFGGSRTRSKPAYVWRLAQYRFMGCRLQKREYIENIHMQS